jgi:hypothetical protein
MIPFEEGKAFYYDEDGLLVLTKEFLLQRGSCCGNACKHCPYNYDNVPEPNRSRLRAEREEENKI